MLEKKPSVIRLGRALQIRTYALIYVRLSSTLPALLRINQRWTLDYNIALHLRRISDSGKCVRPKVASEMPYSEHKAFVVLDSAGRHRRGA